MSEPRPTTLKIDRTHLLAMRGSPLASTHLMPPAPAPQPPQPRPPAPTRPAATPRLPPYAPPAAFTPPPVKACSPTEDPRLIMFAEPGGERAAAFRAMRDTLLAKSLPRLLAVSSADEGEGKTTCAVNLALAFAEQGNERVLLLDASFAEPALAEMLGVDDGGPAWFAPFTLSALTPALHVATVVRRPGTSYVDTATLARSFGAFHRAGYHRVIVDTARVADAMPILGLAGGVLLAARAGRSQQRALRRAVDLIGARRCVGVMLMDA